MGNDIFSFEASGRDRAVITLVTASRLADESAEEALNGRRKGNSRDAWK